MKGPMLPVKSGCSRSRSQTELQRRQPWDFWAAGGRPQSCLGQLRPAKSGFLSIRTCAAVVLVARLWVSIQFPIPAPPRRIRSGSGPTSALPPARSCATGSSWAPRHRVELKRSSARVKTSSAAGSRLGVDVAFVQADSSSRRVPTVCDADQSLLRAAVDFSSRQRYADRDCELKGRRSPTAVLDRHPCLH